MSRTTLARMFVATALAVTLAACSDLSPVAPGGFSASAGDQAAAGVPGVYQLAFFARVGGAFQEVASLPVFTAELILQANVSDTSGNPALKGTVTFEYCSVGKGPSNDINRPDEAAKEACEQGLATWKRLESRSVENGGNCLALGGGSACKNFGIVRIPRTVGFRFRYAQQKGSIASGMSEARNFVWVE